MRSHVIALFVIAEPEQESGWCSVSPTRSLAGRRRQSVCSGGAKRISSHARSPTT